MVEYYSFNNKYGSLNANNFTRLTNSLSTTNLSLTRYRVKDDNKYETYRNGNW